MMVIMPRNDIIKVEILAILLERLISWKKMNKLIKPRINTEEEIRSKVAAGSLKKGK